MKRVLLVEDDLIIARIYQGLIRKQGVEVTVAADGELAIQALAQLCPDLVILDLMLPKKNGVEVLRFIRSVPALRNVPVIVFTNASMGTLVQEAIEAGATACLIKANTSPRQLLETLGEFIALGSPDLANGTAAAVGAQ